MAPGKKQGQQSTLERFEGIIRRVVSKNDDRSSLVDDIACVVGAEILEGLRRPGSDLNSVELARRFRTSRTPTREAVVILEKEGLVEILPRRRPRVADLSIAEIREIYRVRAAMLGLIAAEVARLATDAEIAELRTILREMERSGCGRRSRRLLLGQCRLPRALRRSGAQQDAAAHSRKPRAAQPAPAPPHAVEPGRTHRSLADHVRLVDALEDRDGELASALIKANVLGALKLLEQLLADGDKAKS